MLNAKPYLRSIQTGVPISGDSFPFNLPALQGFETLEFHPDCTFFIGENGSGKSTLMEAIVSLLNLNIQGGSQHFKPWENSERTELAARLEKNVGHLHPQDQYFLRAESFYNVATSLDDMNDMRSYGGKYLNKQSHGEAFMSVLLDRLGGNGLYIFDEPEAALSPARQLVALRAIHMHVQNHSQFIIATHSPILMAYPNSVIYEFGDHGIKRVNYKETEHYDITYSFLSNPELYLKELFKD